MPLAKQAKILNQKQVANILRHLENNRYPERDRVLFLLSCKAGLRAKEITSLTWGMVMDGDRNINHAIHLEDNASKGKGGRIIPMHADIKQALVNLYDFHSEPPHPSNTVIYSERGSRMSANAITHWFKRLYISLGLIGCSSHSGRRTFVTKVAKKIIEAGGSLRDVQQLAGHSSLQTTQRYIEGDSEAKRKVMELI